MRVLSLVLACGATWGVAGCAAPVEPVGESADTLDTSAALPTVEAPIWQHAPAGCEGRLLGDERYAVTAEHALVVALTADVAVCVDTLTAIEAELDALGTTELAIDGLQEAYALSILGQHLTLTSRPIDGDPNPQPSIAAEPGIDPGDEAPAAGPNDGDPNPQPSMDGDPNPQPSRPASSDDKLSGGSSNDPVAAAGAAAAGATGS